MNPTSARPGPDGEVERQLVEEMASQPYEPMLPVEKKLVFWSLVLGVSLLGLLAWLSHTLFPVPKPPI